MAKVMSRRSELEGRLDGLVSRIAMETQEIKELEQLLTDGQILANENLKRDLEGVICGFEKYLGELRQQAQFSQQQVNSLQAENQTLRLNLEEAQRRYRQLEERHTQEICSFQGEVPQLQAELVQNPAWCNQTKPDQITAREDRLADNQYHRSGLQVQMNKDQNWRLKLQKQSRSGRCLQKLQVYAGSCEHKDAERRGKKLLRLETSERQQRRHGTVMQICEEVECVEKTLLKRRAELREADRRLLEAQRCVHATRDQAAELQHRVQNSATCLLEAAKHLRTLQEEEQQLMTRRQKEQQALVEVEEMLRKRNEELRQLNLRTEAADRLADMLKAPRRLDSLTCQKLLSQEEQREARSRKGEQTLNAELITQRAEPLEQQARTGVKNKHTQRKEALQQKVGNKREEAAPHLRSTSRHQCLRTQQENSAVLNRRPDLLTLH